MALSLSNQFCRPCLKPATLLKRYLFFRLSKALQKEHSGVDPRIAQHQDSVPFVTKTSILEVTEALDKSLTPFYQSTSQWLLFKSSCGCVINK